MISDIRPPRRPYKAAQPLEDTNPELPKIQENEVEPSGQEHQNEPPKKPMLLKAKNKKHWWQRKLSTKEWIIFGSAALFAVGGTLVGSYFLYKHLTRLPKEPVSIASRPKIEEPPKPATEPSKLTGLQVAPELNQRPVIGYMIENSPEARPQAGLKDAGMVFEAIAEGGITRFLALFQESQPDYIGPIRSARPYYLDWALPFDAGYAHVGGSPDALSQIKSLGIRDLDQFANSAYYQRVSTRFAPHNVYTGTAKMYELMNKKGYASSNFTGFARKDDTLGATPNAKTIDVKISSTLYNSRYDYDATTNTYKRSLGGKPHTDEKSGAQLAPKVVLVLVTPYGIAADRVHSQYTTVGSGKLFVFQDGVLTEGTWKKDDRKSQFIFTDSAGTAIKFNAGQTWLTMVANAGMVTYQP